MFSLLSLHLVLVDNKTFSGYTCHDVECIQNSIWLSLPTFKKHKGLFSEDFCRKQLFSSTSSESFNCISIHKVTSNVPFLLLMNFWRFFSGKVHKFSLCSTEEIWLDTEMSSEIKIQGCLFYSSLHMFLIFYPLFFKEAQPNKTNQTPYLSVWGQLAI